MQKKYDILRLFRDRGVSFDSPNTRGFATLQCPKCGGDRLGYSPEMQFFSCWLCKGLPFARTLAGILKVQQSEVWKALEPYAGKGVVIRKAEKVRGGAAELVYPQYTGKLQANHIAYLRKRGLDAEQVIEEFGMIYGIPGHAPKLANHIVAPLYLDGEAVSYQCRSIVPTCPKEKRYWTCPPLQEKIWHKSILYGLDQVPGDTAVVVEGLFDCFKAGFGAVHCFGVSFLPAQVLVLAKRFKKVFVAFDSKGPSDPKGLAQRAGRELAEALSGLGVEAAVVDIGAKDFGDLPLSEARSIMADLGM
jgi:predicted transcriptional regulator